MKLTLAVIASVLAIAGNLPYVISIFRGVTKPHPFTWFVWTLVSGIVFFGQLAKGAGVGALPTLASEIFTLIIFILSLRYGYRDVTRSDVIYLAIALLAIVLWIATADPAVSVTIAVGIDIVAFLPTLRKAAKEPVTEHPALYLSNVVRHILALFSLEAYNLTTVLHSAAMITTNSVMSVLLLGRRILSPGERKAPQ